MANCKEVATKSVKRIDRVTMKGLLGLVLFPAGMQQISERANRIPAVGYRQLKPRILTNVGLSA